MLTVIFCGIVCVICLGNFLICYLRSKGQYDDYMEYVDKEVYGLKDFIPLGLWLNEHLPFQNRLPMPVKTALARYQSQVYQKVLELNGPRDAAFFHFIHKGYGMAVGILGSAAASLMGLIITVQGDATTGLVLSAGALVVLFGGSFLVDYSLNEKIAKRRRTIQMEFPEFINKLTLLVNAGMTVSKAWEKIINENKKDHVLYQEMNYAMAEIQSGKPEPVAYENFARRCHIKEVTKFVSIIIMNLKRGGEEVVPVLREQGNECWQMRKDAAKQAGEEAGSKILIPMMIMFLGIVLIVATPALLSMTGGM